MSNLDIIKSIYKPYRFTKINNVTLIDSSSGKFVIKPQKKDLFGLFSYLKSRNFDYIPELTSNYRNKENVFSYINEDLFLKEQKEESFAKVVALLHTKTVYFKDVYIDDYNEIIENIQNNIDYLEKDYHKIFTSLIMKEYVSPSEYLLLRNIYKYKKALSLSNKYLEKYKDSIKDKSKQRIAIIHNNLSLDHFIYNKALISFDDYKIDTPILDIINLFKKEYLNIDINLFYKNYIKVFPLNEDEKYLLFSSLLLPISFEEKDNNFEKTLEVKRNISYLNKVFLLVGENDLKEDEE